MTTITRARLRTLFRAWWRDRPDRGGRHRPGRCRGVAFELRRRG